jgi:omega-amidase
MDVNLKNSTNFRESEFIKPGKPSYSVLQTEFGNIGIGVCRDIRPPEYTMVLAQKYQCKLVIFPANFANSILGECHWQIFKRSRAIDSLIFIAGCAPARNIEEPECF